jgi:CRISPR-associated protein Csb3
MKPEPNISVPVDLTNPGQFFACCGLLELAARIDPNASGCFREQQFVVSTKAGDFLNRFFSCEVQVGTAEMMDDNTDEKEADDDAPLNPHRGRILPMRLLEPFNLCLDWWNDEQAQDQKLKTWTAGQRVTDLLTGHKKKRKRTGKSPLIENIPSMRDRFADAVKTRPNDWLRSAFAIDTPGAFSYDSRLSRNNALDLGHTERSTFAFSPAVDVLTLIGLQRFRPLMTEQWSRNQYCTWHEPVPVEIAAVVALGVIPHLIHACFEFPIKPRDSQGRYKLFGHAQPIRRSHV